MTLMLNSFVDCSAICCQNKVNDESKKKKKNKNNYVTCRALGSAENTSAYCAPYAYLYR
jgi:16S rRNA G527 N7-methylase RsmG